MTEKNPTRLAYKLQILRAEEREKLYHMAERLDMSPSYLSMIESGLRPVPITFVVKLQLTYCLDDEYCNRLKMDIEEDKKYNDGLQDFLNEAASEIAPAAFPKCMMQTQHSRRY